MAWHVPLFPYMKPHAHIESGTRYLTRRDKEVDLFVKFVYYGMTVGRGTSPVPAIIVLLNVQCAKEFKH